MQADELPCPKCKEGIKASALKCKHCGHEMSQAEVEARKKENRNNQAVGMGCVVLLFAVIFLVFCSGGDSEVDSKSAADAAEEKRKGFHCLSDWDGSHVKFKEKVKAKLRDPDSFEHDSTRVSPEVDGSHTILMKYRARNGFGGMNVETAMGSFDHQTCEPSELIITE